MTIESVHAQASYHHGQLELHPSREAGETLWYIT